MIDSMERILFSAPFFNTKNFLLFLCLYDLLSQSLRLPSSLNAPTLCRYCPHTLDYLLTVIRSYDVHLYIPTTTTTTTTTKHPFPPINTTINHKTLTTPVLIQSHIRQNLSHPISHPSIFLLNPISHPSNLFKPNLTSINPFSPSVKLG